MRVEINFTLVFQFWRESDTTRGKRGASRALRRAGCQGRLIKGWHIHHPRPAAGVRDDAIFRVAGHSEEGAAGMGHGDRRETLPCSRDDV